MRKSKFSGRQIVEILRATCSADLPKRFARGGGVEPQSHQCEEVLSRLSGPSRWDRLTAALDGAR